MKKEKLKKGKASETMKVFILTVEQQEIINEAIESYIIKLRSNIPYLHPVSERKKTEVKIDIARKILNNDHPDTDKWSEYEKWLSRVEFLAISVDRFNEFPDKWEQRFKGWYNSGFTPKEIIDNLDFHLNPSHP